MCQPFRQELVSDLGQLLSSEKQPGKTQGYDVNLSDKSSCRTWANSFLQTNNLVKRKATKAAKKVPENFEEIKTNFLSEITKVVREHKIPDHLIINMDKTGLSIVPVDKYTLEVGGSMQLAVTGQEDQREITCVVACTLSGLLLPPQLIYEGKTDRCHPKVRFPKGWDIYHSSSH